MSAGKGTQEKIFRAPARLSFITVAALRLARRFLESASLYPPLAALRRFPQRQSHQNAARGPLPRDPRFAKMRWILFVLPHRTIMFFRRRIGLLLVPLPLMLSPVESMHKLDRNTSKQTGSVAFSASLCWALFRAPDQRQRTLRQSQFVFAKPYLDSETQNKDLPGHSRKSDLFLAARHRFGTVAPRRLARLIRRANRGASSKPPRCIRHRRRFGGFL